MQLIQGLKLKGMEHAARFWRKAARNFSTLLRVQGNNLAAVPNLKKTNNIQAYLEITVLWFFIGWFKEPN